MSNVDRQQWRRQKYLDMLYENLGEEQIQSWVSELETEQAVNSDIDFAVSMDFLSAYNYDFANVPLINDGEFEPWDQNRWTQLMYKHTGDMQYLEMLKRPSFIQTNE